MIYLVGLVFGVIDGLEFGADEGTELGVCYVRAFGTNIGTFDGAKSGSLCCSTDGTVDEKFDSCLLGSRLVSVYGV